MRIGAVPPRILPMLMYRMKTDVWKTLSPTIFLIRFP